jgi:hypothetical protein
VTWLTTSWATIAAAFGFTVVRNNVYSVPNAEEAIAKAHNEGVIAGVLSSTQPGGPPPAG